jgi:hypothetical protein
MLSPDKHCEMLSANARDRAKAMEDWFKLFVQIFSVIVGGAVLLRLQYKQDIPVTFVPLSNALVLLVAFASAAMVIDSHRAWRGHRKRLSDIAGPDIIPQPRVPSWIGFLLMLAVILVALFGFCLFNPLRI